MDGSSYGNAFGTIFKVWGLMAGLALIGALTIVAGLVYGLLWLIQHVRFV